MSLSIKILISAFLGFLAISLLVIFFGAMRPASAAPTSKAKTYRPVVAKTVKKAEYACAFHAYFIRKARGTQQSSSCCSAPTGGV